jgi:hypothetical protein
MLERSERLGTLRSVTGLEPLSEDLLPRDREILDFERCWWQQPGPKERAVRERFGFSAARYQQLLNRAIDLPEALAYDPMLVRRLRRLREQRRRRRVATRLGLPV